MLFGRLLIDLDITGANGIEDKINDSITQNRDNETEDGIKYGVLGIGNLLLVATRGNIADTASNNHNNSNNTDNIENNIGNPSKSAVVTD